MVNSRQREQRTSYALVVENKNKTYKEVVKGIKERVMGKVEVNSIEEIRETRSGKVLIQMQRNKEAVEQLRRILGEDKDQRVSSRGIVGKEIQKRY